MQSWASAGLLLLGLGAGALAQDAALAKLEKGIVARVRGGRTVLSIPEPAGTKAGGRWRVSLERDETIAKGAVPGLVKVVGVVPGTAVVLVDTYPSVPGGMGYCQAGQESFLRVIGGSGGRAVETFHEKLESCRENIELKSPGMQWNAQAKTLEVDWLSAPGQTGKEGHQTLRVGEGAKVEATPAPQ